MNSATTWLRNTVVKSVENGGGIDGGVDDGVVLGEVDVDSASSSVDVSTNVDECGTLTFSESVPGCA